MSIFSDLRQEWRHQVPVVLDQAAPVSNQWYTALNYTGRYTLIHSIRLLVLVANETLEMEIVIDGITELTAAFVATAGTTYNIGWGTFIPPASSFIIIGAISTSIGIVGHNIRVRIRKTTAAGAGNLQCKVIHAVK